MKQLLIIFLGVLCLSFKGDVRYYNWSQELHENYSWKYYTKKEVPGGFSALTVVKREFEASYSDNLFSIDYKCLLDTKQSCYDRKKYSKSLPSVELLRHEQLHFDMYEYYRWEFFKRIQNVTTKNPEKYFNEIKKIKKAVEAECEKEQNKYDRETKHSQDRANQAQWEKNFYTIFDAAEPITYSSIKVKLE